MGPATLTNGVATLPFSFAATSSILTNSLTAVYAGDANYTGSNASAIAVYSGPHGLSAQRRAPQPDGRARSNGLDLLHVRPRCSPIRGPSPSRGSGLAPTLGCVFSPASVTADGSNTPSLIGLFRDHPCRRACLHKQPRGQPRSPRRAAARWRRLPWPAFPAWRCWPAPCCGASGLAGQARDALLLLSLLLGVLGMGATGCGVRSTLGTPENDLHGNGGSHRHTHATGSTTARNPAVHHDVDGEVNAGPAGRHRGAPDFSRGYAIPDPRQFRSQPVPVSTSF